MPSAGPSSRRAGHADLGVAADDRDVGHERELEAAAERIGLDLRHGHLRELAVLLVEAEGLAVDAEAAALARPAGLALVVPAVRVVHVRAGGEDAAGTANYQNLYVVIGGDLVKQLTESPAHRRVVGVAPGLVVDRDAGHMGLGVALEVHALVCRCLCHS